MYDATETLTACANAVTITGPFGTPTTNTALGQRHFTYDANYQCTQIILKHTGNTERTLTSSQARGLIWSTSQLATTNYLSSYTTTALNTL